MKIYQCSHCYHPVYFNNITCEKCKSQLGYLLSEDRMVAMVPGTGNWDYFSGEAAKLQYCSNHQYDVCNWLVAGPETKKLCEACDLNNTIPDTSDPSRLSEWRRLEFAKHRMVYALRRLGLPFTNRMAGRRAHLEFDFLSQEENGQPVMTGHAAGLITINTAEANILSREATRIQMHERYRTLIGHFRHEVGHYYWDVLIDKHPTTLASFRALFGDDRENYQEALQRHYQNGAPANWQEKYISEYATTHAWEDWAETWAHYLHLIDMLETAHSFGMKVDPPLTPGGVMSMEASFDPYREPDMARIISACIPLTLAVNALNRGMGRKYLYPFVIKAAVREKLAFVHQVVRAAVSSPS